MKLSTASQKRPETPDQPSQSKAGQTHTPDDKQWTEEQKQRAAFLLGDNTMYNYNHDLEDDIFPECLATVGVLTTLSSPSTAGTDEA